MPMIVIMGLANDTPQDVLEALQDKVEAALASGLKVNIGQCQSEPCISPVKRKRKTSYVWGSITTALFQNNPTDEDSEKRVQAATKATAEMIWKLLDGKFTVEIFPPPYMDQAKLKTVVKKRGK